MHQEDIKGIIINILEESSSIDKEEILKVCNLISDEIIDSLGMIELISVLEKEFNIVFSEDDLILDNFETIDKIVDLIQLKNKQKMKNILLIGGGGHASNIIDLILNEQEEYKVIGYIDKKEGPPILGVPWLGNDSSIKNLRKNGVEYGFPAIGFGKNTNNNFRKSIYQNLKLNNFKIPNLISKYAIIRSEVRMGEGVLVQAGSVIDTKSVIGNNVAFGFNVLAGHNSYIADHVFLAGGVILNGGVNIGLGSFLGWVQYCIKIVAHGVNFSWYSLHEGNS